MRLFLDDDGCVCLEMESGEHPVGQHGCPAQGAAVVSGLGSV